MQWLERIRNKPYQAKVRLIWTITGVVFVLLIALWIISEQYRIHAPKDTTLFQTIGRGIRDIGQNYKNIPDYIKNHE